MFRQVNEDHNEEISDAEPARRNFLKSAALGIAAAGLSAALPVRPAQAQESGESPTIRESFDTTHALKPLNFNASNLNGLSARLIESHWSNNYGGSVRTLNAVNEKLADALADKDTPAYVYNSLKREHLMRTGSVILHELYFDNLGGSGQAGADMRTSVGAAFGDFGSWETEFNRIAMGLGGGSGWVVFGYNTHFNALENYWLADHMHFPASTVPLLVLDMYEHSYQMDFGAATARYVEAFFKNIQWDVVSARFAAI
jgi:Fe-Mn family superoxide dismutase